MSEPTTEAGPGERAALALAETRPKNTHGQLCPVWTQRHRTGPMAVKRGLGATIADCDCWILADARIDVAVVYPAIEAEARADALREAAERVREHSSSPPSLDVAAMGQVEGWRAGIAYEQERVLAILDPETKP